MATGDPALKSVKRFVAPVRLGEKDAYAYITAKESVEHGHRIYSIELEKLEALAGMFKERTPRAANASEVPEGTGDNIANPTAEGNGEIRPSIKKRDEVYDDVLKLPLPFIINLMATFARLPRRSSTRLCSTPASSRPAEGRRRRRRPRDRPRSATTCARSTRCARGQRRSEANHLKRAHTSSQAEQLSRSHQSWAAQTAMTAKAASTM